MHHQHWEAICLLSKQDSWQGEVPQVQWDLRNAIGSLMAQQPELWDNPHAIPNLLEQNPGVAKIFSKYNDCDIAHALRLARYARAR
jgi:hypothetical protein